MLNSQNIAKIASLSRIQLTANESARLSKDLDKILQYITKLKVLDTSNIQPTSHIFPLKNVYRADKVKPSLTQEEALSIAPEKHKGFFKVPKVIET